MFHFGDASNKRLRTCHSDLQTIANGVMDLQIVDFTIVWGYRNKDQQMQAFLSGNSTKQWPDSKHNKESASGDPMSHALDFAPWIHGRIPWDDTHAFAIIGGLFLAVAARKNIMLRYGGDWDRDGETKDQTLMDWGHVELIR